MITLHVQRPHRGSGGTMPPHATSHDDTALLSALTSQRDHVLGILDGLSPADLRRPVLPSGWTCLGLVKHLALDVERFWFRSILAGEPVDLASGADAWQVSADTPAEAVFGLYRQERSEEHTSELQSPVHLVCRLLLEKKKASTTKLKTLDQTKSSKNKPALASSW